ncbi:MAG: agmatine deiminase family protein [Eubacterium sp.]|nr:agmatine deiminase family protein [Eubacterium sp.]
MLYFSPLLKLLYNRSAERLFEVLDKHGIEYKILDNTNDIWLRDFMPTKTKTGKYVSFRYEPSYLDETPHLKTDFRKEIAPNFPLENLVYSNINLDGGNIVFSPSKKTAVISDRIFTENEDSSPTEFVQKLEQLLEAEIIIIPSLKSDFTGHADGMVRFIDEYTALVNDTPYKTGLEQKIAKKLNEHGIDTISLPYFDSPKESAVGCYINFLETEQILFLPIFDVEMDSKAIETAKNIFNKTIVPVNINEVAEEGGVLNCISWEI